MDIYPMVDVFTLYIPVYSSRMKSGLAQVLNSQQTAIHIRVDQITKVMGSLQAFAIISPHSALLLRSDFAWVTMEKTTLELELELFRKTYGKLT